MATKEQDRGKGFGRGVDRMREMLASEFEKYGDGEFTGREIANIIRTCASPTYSADPAELPSDLAS